MPELKMMRECVMCHGPIDPGSVRCTRCHRICKGIGEPPPDCKEGDYFLIDVKSSCCMEDVEVVRRATCSADCHEAYVIVCELAFGKHKKIVDMATGTPYKVPTRRIVEVGIKQEGLPNFRVWRD